MSNEERFVCEAIELARSNVEKGGRPFGAVVVREDQVVATGLNFARKFRGESDLGGWVFPILEKCIF